MMLETLAVIGLGLFGGYYLSTRFGDHATAVQSMVHLTFATMWVLAALITIYTGFYIAGAILLVLFSYFWFSNYRTVRDSDIRRKTSSWNPFGYDQK
ncbi:hypothetical protein [Halomontanus rarus]|uniref:hypothetical protein n=1 Tax=Halomontanus rarus TaxID=3034020 RepID=UPI0023E7B236|nr:hypothetical protein [Halovivax sp. TS33]